MTIDSRMSYDASYVTARKKAVKQLKNSNAQQLEIETKKMEDRIRALKEQMFREKEEREKQGGTRWESGKSGPLNSHAQKCTEEKQTQNLINLQGKSRFLEMNHCNLIRRRQLQEVQQP
ncbi:hypothetical protein OS493_018351 [Desmophyllum pertusum]|uniref:Uncharacterized protein n=1 Tax=Desmophyllum pertusum TaxID=174260 RepID=A0A9X0CEA2_9CNID|nr:hypothetical protein OS493_018351 [Desmophyllum pertusum]